MGPSFLRATASSEQFRPETRVWRFRYPGEVDSPALAEATDALALAREAHATVVAAMGERLF